MAEVKQNTSDSTVSTTERTDFPTIEQLAAPDDAMSIPDIVTKLSPSVVGISCITDGSSVSGTGIIMSEDGYIITNAHVVEGASAISVVVTDSTAKTEETSDDSSSKSVAEKIIEKQSDDSGDDENTITAELIGMDTQTDIAVLKIDKTGLTAAEFGTSSDIQVGELAIVIGNPLGFDLANTVTSGIISATDRTLTIEDRTMNLIQTDASINSGNSGGPLINAYGQVIGITSAKVSSTYGEGLGFAIPIDEAKTIINDLVQYGYVKGRPTLGISGENISSFYAQYYNVPNGFIVRSVESGSAAEEAGIKVNDMIVGIQGELIDSIEEFNEIKSQYKAGDQITVSVYRNDNIVDLDVTLGEAVDTSSTQEESEQDQQDTTDDYSDGYDDFRQFYDYYKQNMR
jgi:serine protease Do